MSTYGGKELYPAVAGTYWLDKLDFEGLPLPQHEARNVPAKWAGEVGPTDRLRAQTRPHSPLRHDFRFACLIPDLFTPCLFRKTGFIQGPLYKKRRQSCGESFHFSPARHGPPA